MSGEGPQAGISVSLPPRPPALRRSPPCCTQLPVGLRASAVQPSVGGPALRATKPNLSEVLSGPGPAQL